MKGSVPIGPFEKHTLSSPSHLSNVDDAPVVKLENKLCLTIELAACICHCKPHMDSWHALDWISDDENYLWDFESVHSRKWDASFCYQSLDYSHGFPSGTQNLLWTSCSSLWRYSIWKVRASSERWSLGRSDEHVAQTQPANITPRVFGTGILWTSQPATCDISLQPWWMAFVSL